MDSEIKKQIDTLEQKIDEVYKSVEKTRKYFLAIIWITIIAVVVPLIGLMFAIPSFINTYVGTSDGLLF